MSLQAALCRPLNYHELSARQQWDIDASLGILDWDPTKKEAEEYLRIREERRRKNATETSPGT